MRLIRYIILIITYPFSVLKIKRRVKQYNEDKRAAWGSFYSENRKWLGRWYREKGLDSKPPVYYLADEKKWVRLNRQQRRHSKMSH